MYQSELVEAHKRGRVVSSEPLFVGVGIVIAYFFDYGIAYAGGPIAWRLPIACQILFAIVSITTRTFGISDSVRLSLFSSSASRSLLDIYTRRVAMTRLSKFYVTSMMVNLAMKRLLANKRILSMH
jgi:hypothetical protein